VKDMDKKTLRKVQMVQLGIAKEIKRVCEILQIQYFLDGGTLLGAIRHNGFIPWDDDMDIGMMRDDYEIFIKKAPDLLKENYFLQTWHTDPGYGLAFAKLRLNNTIYLEKAAQYSSAHCGIYVDIIPYDDFPNNISDRKWQGRQHYILKRMILVKSGYRPWAVHISKVGKIVTYCVYMPIRILVFFINKRKLIKKFEKIATAYNREKTDNLYIQGGADYGEWVVPCECFSDYAEHTFEDTVFMIPAGYDSYLRNGYGDYMQLPPECKREDRHKIIKVEF